MQVSSSNQTFLRCALPKVIGRDHVLVVFHFGHFVEVEIVVNTLAADRTEDHSDRRTRGAEVRVGRLKPPLINVLLPALRTILRPALLEQQGDGRDRYSPWHIPLALSRLVHNERSWTSMRCLDGVPIF